MPPIECLDNLTDYDDVALLDTIISTGPAIFAILFAVFVIGDIWNVIKKKKDKKSLWSVAWAVCIAIQIEAAACLILCILYAHDGRYSHQNITIHDSSRYYFGQVNNGQPDGFGKEFMQDKTIYYVGDFVAGAATGEGTLYAKSGDDVYMKYTGGFQDNKVNGKGKSNRFVAGEECEVYSGGYKMGEYDGSGKQTLWNDDGTVASVYEGSFKNGEHNGWGALKKYKDGEEAYSYTGGWANGSKFGYGTELTYENGGLIEAYQGTFWSEERYGAGIWEYYSNDSGLIVWVGYSADGERTDDGAYYYAGGEFLPTEENHSSVLNEGTGNWETDEGKKAELMERWPYPTDDTLIAD